jgi:hypothetical protein
VKRLDVTATQAGIEDLVDELVGAGEDPSEDDDLLIDLKEQLEQAREIQQDAYSSAAAKDNDGKSIATVADIDKYKKASDTYFQFVARITDLTEKIAKKKSAAVARGLKSRRQVIASELAEQYGDMGVQYRHLIDMLAGISVMMEAREGEGSGGKEYLELMDRRLDIIGQLQKHTESTKEETLDLTVVNAVAVQILMVFESLLRDQPTLFKEGVLKGKELIGGEGEK